MRNGNESLRLGRRAFLKHGTLILTAASVNSTALSCPATCAAASATDESAHLKIAMVTDLHYADKHPAGSRHYRETLGKLDEAAKQFEEEQPHFLVELGDLIDAADSVEVEQQYLKTINERFSEICADRYYVLGNHCVDTLTKNEFLDGVEQEESYFSFDRGEFHFIVLDSCFRSDGVPYGRRNFKWNDANFPAAEIEWLEADLKACNKPVVLFAHQRLDASNNHSVKNNAAVRRVLETSGKVLAVFQGHNHQNDLNEISGIHYCTLRAMVEGSGAENSGYSLMKIEPNGTIHLSGFRKQSAYDWPHNQ